MPQYIVVTTDDMRPSMIPTWKTYWDELKRRHTNLKVTVYTPIYYNEFGINIKEDISQSNEFKEWYEERKDWVSIIPHSCYHTKPFENQKSYEEQKESIKISLEVLKDYIDLNCKGWKSPFYKMGNTTIQVLRELGFSFYDQWWTINLLKVNNRPFPPYLIIGTHTSSKEQNNPDAIDVIWEKLDKQLTEFEKQGCEYSTVVELVKYVLK